MDPGYPQLQSQLRTILPQLKMCVQNSILQLQFDNQKQSNDFKKEQITTSELGIQSLEDSREKLTKHLSDKDEKISHLKCIIQQLEDQIKKLNKVEECTNGKTIDLKEEISRLNKVIMDKEDKLAQLHEKLENQETELCHRQQQKEKLQQQYDDSKKTHKLELTKINSVLSSNTEELFQLINHN